MVSPALEMTFRTRPIAWVLAALAVTTPVGLASEWYVDDDASSAGDATSWETAHDDLRQVLAMAGPGDTVHVAGGTYAMQGLGCPGVRREKRLSPALRWRGGRRAIGQSPLRPIRVVAAWIVPRGRLAAFAKAANEMPRATCQSGIVAGKMREKSIPVTRKPSFSSCRRTQAKRTSQNQPARNVTSITGR